MKAELFDKGNEMNELKSVSVHIFSKKKNFAMTPLKSPDYCCPKAATNEK